MWFCEIDWIAVATVALVIVTGYYAFSTYKILGESQKTRDATERLANSSEQANKLLRQQIEEAAGLGKEIIRSAYQTASFNIKYWKAVNILDLATRNAIPLKIELVPPDAQSAVYHARRLSPDGAAHLSYAFDKLRIAQSEIEILREAKIREAGFDEKHAKRALEFIDAASVNLEAGKDCLQKEKIFSN